MKDVWVHKSALIVKEMLVFLKVGDLKVKTPRILGGEEGATSVCMLAFRGSLKFTYSYINYRI